MTVISFEIICFHLFGDKNHLSFWKSFVNWWKFSFGALFIQLVFFSFSKKILFIYLFETEREREAETQAEGEGEAGSMHREPDVGFDPGSPGSRPGPKAGAKPLRHPGIPKKDFKQKKEYLLSVTEKPSKPQF